MEALALQREINLPVLKGRQQEVFLGLIDGKSEKQIASALGISTHTVHVYVKAIYRRCQVHSRGELLAQFISRLLREGPLSRGGQVNFSAGMFDTDRDCQPHRNERGSTTDLQTRIPA